jgi:DNA-binding ferritin-like protein
MLEELLADTQGMKQLVMQVFEAAQAEQREDIANFMAERQNSHGKYEWQLKSFLKDARA